MNFEHAIKTILDFKDKIKSSDNIEVPVMLLETAVTEINQWKELADDFASCIVITQGETKPRVAVDIEKFLETQHNYKMKSDGL